MTVLARLNHNITLKGRLVTLRPITESEITQRYSSWLAEPEINRFLEARGEKTLDELREYVNSIRLNKNRDVFAIFTNNNNAHIGNISITHFNPLDQGYAIFGTLIGDLNARKYGAGGEAITLIIEYLFSFNEIRRLQAGAASDNIAGQRSLEFLGFMREGVLRDHIVLESGKLNDGYIYGLLKEEWDIHKKKLEHTLKHMKIEKTF